MSRKKNKPEINTKEKQEKTEIKIEQSKKVEKIEIKKDNKKFNNILDKIIFYIKKFISIILPDAIVSDSKSLLVFGRLTLFALIVFVLQILVVCIVVFVIVKSGGESFVLPDVQGKEVFQAFNTLEKEGMNLNIQTHYFNNYPLGTVVTALTDALSSLSGGSTVLLAIAVGCMIAFDMGGPVNKVAFSTAAALIAEGNSSMMGMAGVAICVPPIGMGIATMLLKKKFTANEREAGKAAAAMGLVGITEGAIPFAAADPIRVLPSIMAGSSVGAIIAGLAGCTDAAPHGGLIVLPVVGNPLMYVLAVLAGVAVVVVMIFLLKKDILTEKTE